MTEGSPLGTHSTKLWVALATLFCAVSYVFFVSAGKLKDWPPSSQFYSLLADGFRGGHLHLSVPPNPALLAQPDPYHPSLRPLWHWDTTLHEGQLYLYWGPVPALLLAPFRTLFGMEQPFYDSWLVLLFLQVRLWAGAWLVWAVLRRCFTSAPSWLAVLSALIFGLTSPIPFFAARPSIYEASIASGQAFVVLGLCFTFAALAREHRRGLLLACGSACWGLAIGCRVSLAVALGCAALLTCAALLYKRPNLRGALGECVFALAPFSTLVLLLLYYNYARFGSFLDFGLDKQLSTMKFSFSLTHFLPNLYSYTLRGMETLCRFPFLRVLSDLDARAFPEGFVVPPDHKAGEPVLGLLRGVPFCLLIPVALSAAVHPRLRQVFSRGTGTLRIAVWLVATALTLATLPLLPALGLWMATMRYELDVIAGITLLGTVGAAALLGATRGTWRWAATVLIAVLGGGTVLVGFLLGFQGYYDTLQTFNAPLFEKLQRIEVCSP